MITECPKCKVPLVMGKAIKAHDKGNCCSGFGPNVIRNPVLIDCLKCPQCGFSDDGSSPKLLGYKFSS